MFGNSYSVRTISYFCISQNAILINTVLGKDKIYDVNTQAGINFRWNDYLTLTGLVNLYYNYIEETMFVPGVTNQAILPQLYGTGRNKVGNSVSTQEMNTYMLQGKYNRIFNRVHELNAIASARMMMRNYELDISEGYNTASDNYQTLDNTQNEKQTYGGLAEWNYMAG